MIQSEAARCLAAITRCSAAASFRYDIAKLSLEQLRLAFSYGVFYGRGAAAAGHA